MLYVGTVVTGLHLKNFAWLHMHRSGGHTAPWKPPARNTMPMGSKGDSIRFGERIFNETPLYAAQYAGAALSCGSCHAEGGIQPWASPMVGVVGAFPMYSKRAGRMISLRDRIEECFVRSENGRPLAYDAPEMQAVVDYIDWLSQPQPTRRPFNGRGLITLPQVKADSMHGAHIYAEQCAGCHGQHGEGTGPLFPPLWGPRSFNDGAGMHDITKMAAFVQQNMPQNRKGNLSVQDAYDVAGFIHTQARPRFNSAFAGY